MYCSKCGAKIDDDSVFCYNCGTEIRARKRETADKASAGKGQHAEKAQASVQPKSRKPDMDETVEIPKVSEPDEIRVTKTEKSAPVQQKTEQSAPKQTTSEKTAPVRESSEQPAPKQTITEKPAPQSTKPVQVSLERNESKKDGTSGEAAAGRKNAGASYDPYGYAVPKPDKSDQSSEDTSSHNTSAASGGAGTSSGGSGTPPQPPEKPGGTASRTGGPTYGTQRQRIRTNRGWFRFLILSIITCGIYGLYYMYALARDVNILCEEDGKHTTGLLGLIGLTIVTCGFFNLYWGASIIDRVAANLALQYKIMINATGLKYILWSIPGVLLFGIGPLIALHTMLKSINQLAVAYNARYGL